MNTLIVVGSGIKFMSHLTIEVKSCIEKSDKVLYLVNEPAMQEWIQQSNVHTESLDFLYTKKTNRNDNYLLIAEYIIKNLENYKTLCVVIYGHPTVFVQPSLYAIKLAEKKGYNTIVMPGISAEDCLFADLLIDPGSCGCQSFEATDFLIYSREYDSSCHLIIWQPSVIGLQGKVINHDPSKGLQILMEYLHNKYPLNHPVILYEAAQYPSFPSQIKKISLKELPKTNISRLATLYIPPYNQKKVDSEMVEKLRSIS